jgi:PadR family transcriptional regulator PadR
VTDRTRDLVQGTLDMLVLKTLALEPMHGYGIALRIEQISDGVFRVNPGSLLPALSRMERAGRVRTEWRTSENNRQAKYYVLTQRGRKALAEERQQWDHQIGAISKILEA